MEEKAILTNDEIKPFAIESIKKHLKAITKSSNYFVSAERYHITICYKTSKYLLPIDKLNNRNYTILNNYTSYNRYEINELIHALILCANLKSEKESNMPLHTFIKEIISFVGMCKSMLAYYTNETYFTSRELYNLPESTKRKVYNYIKSVISDINYNIGTDSEGNSYNSINLTDVVLDLNIKLFKKYETLNTVNKKLLY